LTDRIKDLRAQLLDAHARMIRRDDEIRKTVGDALGQRNALLIERDALIGQRDALVAQLNALNDERAAWLDERAALSRSLRHAEARLNLLRKSPLGLAYRALRRLVPGRSGPRT
jgi:predicted  nucleic acid-binding Zn-ribbon protein